MAASSITIQPSFRYIVPPSPDCMCMHLTRRSYLQISSNIIFRTKSFQASPLLYAYHTTRQLTRQVFTWPWQMDRFIKNTETSHVLCTCGVAAPGVMEA